MESNSDTDSVAELEYNTWDDARAWEFRNARGNMNVSLSQNSRIEMNREYVSEVDTVIGSDADYNAMSMYTSGNCLSHAVCDDSVALMPLIQFIRALFSDGGDTVGRSEHDSDDDGSPAGLLGYLPRCLYWPWSLHWMTQCQVEIKRPSANGLSRVVMYDGGLWDSRSSATGQ